METLSYWGRSLISTEGKARWSLVKWHGVSYGPNWYCISPQVTTQAYTEGSWNRSNDTVVVKIKHCQRYTTCIWCSPPQGRFSMCTFHQIHILPHKAKQVIIIVGIIWFVSTSEINSEFMKWILHMDPDRVDSASSMIYSHGTSIHEEATLGFPS